MSPLRVVAPFAVLALFVAVQPGCGPPPIPSQYEAYDCPAPIGKIVREDCRLSALHWEGKKGEGGLNVGEVGIHGSYQEQAIREADDLIAILKEQRTQLCHDFNTCKVNVEQYRLEKERNDATAMAVIAIRGNVQQISSGDVTAYLEEIRKIRSGGDKGGPRPQPPQPQPPGPQPPQPQPPGPQPPQADWQQWRPAMYMLQATTLVARAASAIEQKTKFGFDIEHGCIVGAPVRRGEMLQLTQSMRGGRDYAIVGGGGEGAINVDIAVVDASGKVVAADSEEDAKPAVRFSVPRDAIYTIKIQLTKASAADAFLAMAILHEGGYAIPEAAIVQSFRAAAQAGAAARSKLAQLGASGLTFHQEKSWSFYSTVLKPGEGSGLTNIAFNGQPAVIVAGADKDGTNIDLVVTETGTGVMVARDTDPDATPVVLLKSQEGKRYDFKVVNAASTGTTLATALVLDVSR